MTTHICRKVTCVVCQGIIEDCGCDDTSPEKEQICVTACLPCERKQPIPQHWLNAIESELEDWKRLLKKIEEVCG